MGADPAEGGAKPVAAKPKISRAPAGAIERTTRDECRVPSARRRGLAFDSRRGFAALDPDSSGGFAACQGLALSSEDRRLLQNDTG
jgi:hypothetical protein